MPEINAYSRLMAMIGAGPWFIEPQRGAQMAEALAYRLEHGPRSAPFLSPEELEANQQRARVNMISTGQQSATGQPQRIARIPLIGAILPRGDMMADLSGGGAVSLVGFQNEFQKVANDPTVSAIVLEMDSPGGQVDMVEETAAMIRAARRDDRPIVAVVNTMAASAAYWLASAADEIVATPSAQVGAIGVFALHQEMSEAIKAQGIVPTFVFEGPRKVEGNPFEPLSDTARAALQESVRATYDQFVGTVARNRGVSRSVVAADPETAKAKDFGGGRTYSVGQLKARGLIGRGGMVDRVATLPEVIGQLARGRRSPARRGRSASLAAARLRLI